jgi:ATP-dependent Lon protease
MENIGPDDVFDVGTIFRLEKVTPLPANRVRVQGRGICRAKAKHIDLDDDNFTATVEEIVTVHSDPLLEEAYFRTTKNKLMDIASTDSRFPKELITSIDNCRDADEFTYIAASSMQLSFLAKQDILEKDKLTDRLSLLDKSLNDEVEIARLERKINAAVRQNIDKNQKEYYLREQLKVIHSELGDDDDERAKLEESIKEKHMPPEIEEKALKELTRMGRMQSSSPDYNVLRSYLDWLIDLEWNYKTTDTEKLSDAVEILNNDHYGLEKIKQRITEYLAVLKLTDGLNAPILCFVGPPGVGKTSIATSIARSLGRKFVRMSLGGVKDEAEIRGHRKTYVGAMPGRIITAIKNAGSINPVFLLDEIDKLSLHKILHSGIDTLKCLMIYLRCCL